MFAQTQYQAAQTFFLLLLDTGVQRFAIVFFSISLLFVISINSASASIGLANCLNNYQVIGGNALVPSYQNPGGQITRFPTAANAPPIVVGAPGNQNNIRLLCQIYHPAAGQTGIFSTGYNESKLIPDWVAYELTPARLTAYGPPPLDRTGGEFTMNGELVALGIAQAAPFSYAVQNHPIGTAAGSSFHKGHLVPNSDSLYAVEAKAASFTFANAVPQFPSFNTGIWNTLEVAVRNYVRNNNSVYVITGVYGTSAQNDAVPAGAPTRNTVGPYPPYRPTIPACFYKVIYDSTAQQAWAYLMPNTNNNAAPWFSINRNWYSYFITLPDLENRIAAAVADMNNLQQQVYAMKFYYTMAPGAIPIPAIQRQRPSWMLAGPGPGRDDTVVHPAGVNAPPFDPVWYDTGPPLLAGNAWRPLAYPVGTSATFPGC